MDDLRALIAERSRQRMATGSLPHSRWYYAKKAFTIFPGTRRAIAPGFLAAYYTRWHAQMSLAHRLMGRIVYAVFHLWLPFRASAVAARHGRSPEWRNRALALARTHFMDPDEIDQFGIDEGERLGGYLRRMEWNRILKRVNTRNWTPDCLMSRKADFTIQALAHGVALASTPAIILDGKPILLASPQSGELVLKPSQGSGGAGLVTRAIGPEIWQDPSAFERWLAEGTGLDFTRERDWVVQERRRTHPDLAAIALDALSTARISTMLNEAGKPEIVTCVFRFAAQRGAIVDNVTAGGGLAPIDLETGRIGLARLGYHGPDLTHHPESGAQIEGVVIPNWEACKAMALAAHAPAFDDYALVGWDIGLTEDGPMILEGNAKPGFLVAQRGERRGWDGTRFGELLAFHLAKSTA